MLVGARDVPHIHPPLYKTQKNPNMHASASIGPRKRYDLTINGKSKSRSFNFLGGCFIKPGVGFSAPSASAGSISVPRSTASICIIVRGSGILNKLYAKQATA